jgi:hypothetical protein
MADAATQRILRKVIREETADLQAEMKTIREVQGQQGIILRTMQSDLSGLKHSFRTQAQELQRAGMLLEDLDHRFQAGNELY